MAISDWYAGKGGDGVTNFDTAKIEVFLGSGKGDFNNSYPCIAALDTPSDFATLASAGT